MTTVLHVEDDLALADAVRCSFESLGFHGTFVIAASVQEAMRILDDPDRQPADLVICDMRLPDGSGLDVVSSIRARPAWARVPIVIAAAQVDRAHVDCAYALGANAYVSKGTRTRTAVDVFATLYEHWLRDVQLPDPLATTRTQRYLATAQYVRRRRAALYMHVGEQLGPAHGELWMDLALREGNLANLLAFLLGQLGSRELPAELLDEAEALQKLDLTAVEELERRPVRTYAEARALLTFVVSTIHAELVDQMIGHLFPVVPVAMATLRSVAAANVEELATWIEAHSEDPELLAYVGRLHADAEQLRT